MREALVNHAFLFLRLFYSLQLQFTTTYTHTYYIYICICREREVVDVGGEKEIGMKRGRCGQLRWEKIREAYHCKLYTSHLPKYTHYLLLH